ncbi:hypothetical protein DPMN_097113 [Dreissena polymorpha]|uniref:EGF-like domain-containing protein n=1 Tax=Dreissena polymorpha TaxID=45954 RepID=A0A9D4L9P2_DREPO|nr:hypothetical protein DPMN_097113 [Dreissena polymorpha]
MGGYWIWIFRLFLLETVIICDSFPYVGHGNSDVTMKTLVHADSQKNNNANEDDDFKRILNKYKAMPNYYLYTPVKRLKDSNVMSEIENRTRLLRSVRRQSENSIANILRYRILHSTLPEIGPTYINFANYGLLSNTQFPISSNQVISKSYSKRFSQALKHHRAPVSDREILNYKEREKRRRHPYLINFGIDGVMHKSRSETSYGAHSIACDPVDQNYCLNGGICVFVVPLNVKTCQCKEAFTGQRCQMWNQEYLLALLSQEIIG